MKDLNTFSKSELIEKIHRLFQEKELTELALDFQNDTFFVFNPDTGKAVHWNKTFSEVSGYSDREIAELKAPDAYYSKEDLEKASNFIKELKHEQKGIIELTLLCKNGKKIPTEYSVSIISIDQGKSIYFVSVGRDITERIKYRKELENRETFLDSIIDQNPYAMWVSDNHGTLIRINNACCDLLNIKAEEVLNRYNIFHDNLVEEQGLMDQVRKVFEHGETVQFRIIYDSSQLKHLELENYTSVILEVTIAPVINADGELVNAMIIHQDITARLKAETELEESKIFNETLLDNSPDIIYVYDIIRQQNIYSNAGISKVLGYTSEEIREYGDTFLKEMMHPDDFQKYLTEILPLYQFAKDDALIEHEYRMKHKNSSWCWLHSKEKIFTRNEDGEPEQIFGIVQDITQRRKSQEEIEKVQRILQETGRIAKIGGWEFDAETLQGTWTEEVARIHDLDPDDPTNVETGLSFYTPESRKIIEKAIQKAIEKGTSYDLELELVSAKGIRKWVRTIGRPEKKGGKVVKVSGSFQDISEMKEAELQIRNNSAFLDAIIENASVSMWISDEKGTAIRANTACFKLFGAEKEEIIGKYNIFKDNVVKVAGYMPLIERVFEKAEVADFIIDYNFPDVTHVDVRNATHRILRSVITPVRGASGKVTNAIIQTIDLTDIKKAEDELMKAKVKAEESDNLKTAFIANISHEIRTPMNGILGFAELLKNPKINQNRRKQYVDVIEQSGNRMLNIINDLIDISRIETGQVEIMEENIPVGPVLENLYIFFKPEAQKRKLDLSYSSDLKKNEEIIRTDRTKLTQVLTNLVSNALKFTSEGSIEFGCSRQKDEFLFFVKDTGKGIHRDSREIIFERFRQTDLTPANAAEGSGLGLAISKAFIEMLGGRIWVESELAKGSVFYFTLPGKKAVSETVKEDPVSQVSLNITGKLTILVVEDDEISYLYLEEILSGENTSILRAYNGRHAIEIFETHPEIGLVLMDLKLPVLNGFDATQRMKEIRPAVPIIAQSAYVAPGDKEKAFKSSCDDYIEKPVRINELFALIEKYSCEHS